MSSLWNFLEAFGRIHQEERDRWNRMHTIFSERKFDAEILQVPACWRRKGRLGHGAGRVPGLGLCGWCETAVLERAAEIFPVSRPGFLA